MPPKRQADYTTNKGKNSIGLANIVKKKACKNISVVIHKVYLVLLTPVK